MGPEQDASIDLLREVVAHHHEGLDGSGYPAGLRGAEVSLAVQMLRSMVQAGKVDGAGGQAGGDCVDALLRNNHQRQGIWLGHAAAGAWEGNRPPGQAGVPYDPPIPLFR